MGIPMDTLRLARGLAEFKAALTFWPGLLVVCLLHFLPRWLLPSFLHLSGASAALLLAALLGLAKHFSAGGANSARRDLRGKLVVVTGGATGIGLQTVRELAKLGAHVVLTARGGETRLKAALSKARQGLPPNVANKISSDSLDLGSFESIRDFAARFLKQHSKLHMLINNAGVMMVPQLEHTSDGLEMQIGTNHFGHFLLTSLLLPALLAAGSKDGEARIVNLSSLAHTMTPVLTYPKQNDKNSYEPMIAYADSKLANIYFTTELQRRYGARGLNSYAVHPGTVNTELARHLGTAFAVGAAIPNFFCNKTPLQGAQTSLYCALSDEAVPGGYHADAQLWPASNAARDAHKAQWLWEESERVCGVKTSA